MEHMKEKKMYERPEVAVVAVNVSHGMLEGSVQQPAKGVKVDTDYRFEEEEW